MHNYIIYRAFGDMHFINECRYALLQYLAVYNLHPPVHQWIIFTDQPALFDGFFPYFPCLSLQEIKANHLPESKTTFLKFLSQTYIGNLLYCDADTYFLQPVEPIFQLIEQQHLCALPEPEYNHKALLPVKLTDYFTRTLHLKSSDKHSPTLSSTTFGLHTLGFSSSIGELWSEVERMQQQMSHLPAKEAEQFAVNYFLQHHKIHNLQGQVVNYRNFPEFKMLLHTFFNKNEEESIPNLIKRVHHFDAGKILQEKNRYHQLPLFKKLKDAFAGKAWSIRQYENKI